MVEGERGESGRRFVSNRRPAATRNCCHSCRAPASLAVRRSPVLRASWTSKDRRDARFRLRPQPAPQDLAGDDCACRREQKSLTLWETCFVILREVKSRAKTELTLLPGLTDLLFIPVSFNNFGLSPEVVRGTQAMGFSEPTPIQLRAFPIILSGKDLIGTAQTGTGKTAAFALPIMTLLAKHGAFRCLVLEPTRELAA